MPAPPDRLARARRRVRFRADGRRSAARAAHGAPASPRRASIRSSPPTPRPTRCSRRCSRRCSTTTTSRGPVKLVPRTLEALPASSDGGRTWICEAHARGSTSRPIRRSAASRASSSPRDYAYTYKRVLDPAVKSPWLWLFEGKLEGGAQARARRRRRAASTTTRRSRASRWSTATRCASAWTRPTCASRSCSRFPTSARSRARWSRRYGLDFGAHPVGTGAFRLAEYKRSSRIVLERNPDYRVETYVPAGHGSRRSRSRSPPR